MKTQRKNPKNSITITIRKRKITPEIAAQMLLKNVSNRPITQSVVRRYASTMTAGGWKVNAETIKFDQNGDLFDGQHRLSACVLSGHPFEAYVAEGVKREVFDTVDIGKGRTASDALYASGKTGNAKLVASIANLAIKMETNGLRLNRYIEPHRVREWVEEHPQVIDAAARVRKLGFLGFTPVLGLAYMIACEKGPEKAEEFFGQLETGEGLSKGDPALTLRETMIKHKSDQSYHKADVLSMSFAAWNAFQLSKDLPVLKRNMGQGLIEAFAA